MAKRDENYYAGSIVGGAIGDALGAPTEFINLETILDIYGDQGVNDYVEFSNGKGQITDDTQMLLFTAEGLLRSWHRATKRGVWGAYRRIVYESYLRWLHTQNDWYADKDASGAELNGWLVGQRFLYTRRSPGNTCLTALRQGTAGTMDVPINNSKGCGGVMRIAPVGLLFHKSPAQAFEIGAELAAMTHGHPSGFLSAGYLAALIAFINNGDSLQDAISKSGDILTQYPGHEETQVAVDKALKLFEQGNPTYHKIELLGGGWVGEEALAISLYCALSYQDNFEKAINLSINHDGDTDSTGAITGNIVGLITGEDGIPKRWIRNLSNYDTIRQMATDLYLEVKWGGFDNPDPEWERKYPSF